MFASLQLTYKSYFFFLLFLVTPYFSHSSKNFYILSFQYPWYLQYVCTNTYHRHVFFFLALHRQSQLSHPHNRMGNTKQLIICILNSQVSLGFVKTEKCLPCLFNLYPNFWIALTINISSQVLGRTYLICLFIVNLALTFVFAKISSFVLVTFFGSPRCSLSFRIWFSNCCISVMLSASRQCNTCYSLSCKLLWFLSWSTFLKVACE